MKWTDKIRLTFLVLCVFLLTYMCVDPAEARTLECGRDSFGISEQWVQFTPGTDELERSTVLAALDLTDYSLDLIVAVLGRPLTVGVEGNRSFAGRHFVILEQGLSRSDLGTLLMHEIGHVHDANILTDDQRLEWASTHAEAFQFFTFGWSAPQADYFQRPIELFAFEFSRIHKPCTF